MKVLILVIATLVFIGCNDNSGNSPSYEDNIGTGPVYDPMTDTSASNSMNDTTAYGMADSARR